MKQILNGNIPSEVWPNVEVDFYKKVELFIDSMVGYDKYNDTFKIFYVREPEAISKIKEFVIKNHNIFDAILTYDEEILTKCENSFFIPFGTTWIHDYNCYENKVFCVSHLTGYKRQTKGHILRQKIHYNQESIIIPKDFYISKYGGVENFCNNKILGDKKDNLFNSQFHICIENSKQKNYFTEKIIDCFVTKTIPIYYGCPNIQDFFDIGGIYTVNNYKDIINVCNNLNNNDYRLKEKYVENNFNLAKKYLNLPKNVKNKIQEILNLKSYV